MTPDGAGHHPFQMTDVAEIEIPNDWMALSAWNRTRVSARIPVDAETEIGKKATPGVRSGSKEQGRWTVRSPSNTRAIGNLVMVELRKGPSGGLGFSITMRDNLEGPNSPIYIKHILPDGAAIKDGRLRPGDRLLQVNDVVMTGKCLGDVTAILRNIEVDALIRIVVSRQVAAQDETKTSPQIMIDKSDGLDDVGSKEDALVSIRSASESKASVCESSASVCESSASVSESSASVSIPGINCDAQMETLRLRVASDGSIGSNQLGLKVKRSKRQNFCGLRVRSVMKGGLADKDGKLQANDHLIEVNGISLADVDRSTAIDIFCSVLQRSFENLGAIDITIIRGKTPGAFPPSNMELLMCDGNSECPTPNRSLETVECDQRIIPFSNVTGEAAVEEEVSVDCLASVDHDVVLSTGKHSSDFFPDGNVLPQVEEPVPSFRENEVVTNGIDCRFHNDNSVSAASPPVSSEVAVQEQKEVELKVACFERQGFGRKSISEKRSSKELLSECGVYRNVKENRKRKDQRKAETNAGSHESTDYDRGELRRCGDQFVVFEPATLESNPQIPIPYGSHPQELLPCVSNTRGSISDRSYALGYVPGDSSQQGTLPVESDWSGNIPTRSIPHGSASHESGLQTSRLSDSSSSPPRSVQPESVLQGSRMQIFIPLQSDLNGSAPLESFPVGYAPCESLPQNPAPPVPCGSHLHKSIASHGFIPSGFLLQESSPLGSTPDVLINTCVSSNRHIKQPKELSSKTTVIGLADDSVVDSNSSSSSTTSQIPLEVFSSASSSSSKPSKKLTASIFRKFFKKGFAEIFGQNRSEAQAGSLRQSGEGKTPEGIGKHLIPNINLTRKDFSLPRMRSGITNSDVISSSHSHPDLQRCHPNALRTVSPNFYNPAEQFLHCPRPTGLRVPLSAARNSFPVQYYRPNPYPFPTGVLVRSPVPAIPTGFAICPTYVPLERAAIHACSIQGDRFLRPPIICPAQLSWVGFGQKFVNVQYIASQEPRLANQ